jgi:L-aminopeptidase/D-esterase-like protein
VAGVDVRGSAPGTRETDLIRPTARVERIHAVCLCGGSAFGLAAADGVVAYLAGQGIGVETGIRPVPIVAGAVIFDLGLGAAEAYPDPALGRAAAEAAAGPEGTAPAEGSLGVGTGATVGKIAGLGSAMKAGVGTAGLRLADGTLVAALVVTNAGGEVVGRDGRVLAGVRDGRGGYLDAESMILTSDGPSGPRRGPPSGRPAGEPAQLGITNTTLAVIGTDAALDRAQARKVAELGHDALARAIRPVHTLYDGDTVFCLATGARAGQAADPVRIGVAAVSVLIEAIERSVLLARGRGGLPGLADSG